MENYLLLPDGSIHEVNKKTIKATTNWFELGLEHNPDFNYKDTDNDKYKAIAYAVSILAYRCITIKANTIMSLPIRFVNDKDEELSRKSNYRKAFGKRKKKLWNTLIKDWNIFGDLFLVPYKYKNYVYFQRMNPSTMHVERTTKGVDHFVQRIHGQDIETWEPDELIYIWDYDPEDDLIGKSPTQYIFNLIGIEEYLESFIKNYFENGGTPAGILSTDQLLRPSDSKRVGDEWERNYGGAANSNKVAVMGGGMKFVPITPTIKDLIIDTIGEYNARQVCSAYGVPMAMALQHQPKEKVQLEAEREAFYRDTIIPEFELIASELDDQAVPYWSNEDQYMEVDKFKIDILQRTLKDITERSTTSFKSGTLTLNESRRMENLPQIIGGDVFFLGGRLIPQDKLSNPTQTNLILEGKPLNQAFDSNPTEPVNPEPNRQAERMRGESPKQRVDQGFGNNNNAKNILINDYTLADIHQDMKQWKKKALNKGSDVSFTPNYIPESYAGFIRRDVRELQSDDEIKTFFDSKIQLFGDTQLISELQKFDNYYDNIHQYIDEYEQTLNSIFFNFGKDMIVDSLRTHESLLYLPDRFSMLKAEMIYALTEISVKIMLAGYQKGEHLTGNEKEIKLSFQQIGNIIKKAKDILEQKVEDFIAFTQEVIKEKLTEWINLGGQLFDFINYMLGTSDEMPEGFKEGKLRYIWSLIRLWVTGETDTLSFYNDGVIESQIDNPITNLVWLTMLDDRVCPRCQPLHGVEFDVGLGGWVHPIEGVPVTQPLHPRCRCFYDKVEL